MKKYLILFLFFCFFSLGGRAQELQKCLDPVCSGFLNYVESEHKHVYTGLEPVCTDPTFFTKDHKCIKSGLTTDESSAIGNNKNDIDEKQKTLTAVIKESSFFKAWKILQLSYLAGL